MKILTHHSKGPEGWAQFKSAPINSKTWDNQDRSWADWMLAHDQTVITIGHDMYQITTITTGASNHA